MFLDNQEKKNMMPYIVQGRTRYENIAYYRLHSF